MKEWILNHVSEFLADCFFWFLDIFYWVVCFSSIVLICVYAGTRDRKPLRTMYTLIIVWIFLEGVGSVL